MTKWEVWFQWVQPVSRMICLTHCRPLYTQSYYTKHCRPRICTQSHYTPCTAGHANALKTTAGQAYTVAPHHCVQRVHEPWTTIVRQCGPRWCIDLHCSALCIHTVIYHVMYPLHCRTKLELNDAQVSWKIAWSSRLTEFKTETTAPRCCKPFQTDIMRSRIKIYKSLTSKLFSFKLPHQQAEL